MAIRRKKLKLFFTCLLFFSSLSFLGCRKWADYKEGFGQFQGKNDEYWLGNDKIYDLLLRGKDSHVYSHLVFLLRIQTRVH